MRPDRRRLAWALVAAAVAPAWARAEAWPAFALERSAVFEMEAGERRWKLMVAWPEGEPPASGWPVLYVLDGEDNFAAAVATARRLAAAGARSGVEPGVVVGVTSENLARRVFDYTPAVPGYAIPAGAPASGLAIGGAEAFLDVLRDRIQPLVLQRWRADRGRQTLLGHSFGGLLALHALCARPEQFQRIVAVSPSLWFGDEIVTREIQQLPSAVAKGRTLLLAGSDDHRAPAGGPSLDAVDAGLSIKGVTVLRQPLAGLSHGGTMYAALATAISTAFASSSAR